MQPRDYLDTCLNEQEQDLIGAFVENEPMKNAVRKVLLAGVNLNGTMRKGKPADPLVNVAFGLVSRRGDYTNEQVGADLNALWKATEMVESSFQALDGYRREKVVEKNNNPAR